MSDDKQQDSGVYNILAFTFDGQDQASQIVKTIKDSGALDDYYIVAQAVVPVQPDDTFETLAKRVLKEEHQLLPKVVAALCRGKIRWRDDGVPYIDNSATIE